MCGTFRIFNRIFLHRVMTRYMQPTLYFFKASFSPTSPTLSRKIMLVSLVVSVRLISQNS